MRRRIYEEDHRLHDATGIDHSDDEDAPNQKASFNQLVTTENEASIKARRIRWMSQICEYWPLGRLAAITNADIDNLLTSYSASHNLSSTMDPQYSLPALTRKPSIILAGSGPGSPHLLTLATRSAIQTADVVLADKLVPEPVLNLIPRRTPVHIARKFPGNADAAQEELLQLGLEALNKGKTVLRLKQGDPYVYGRGAEEFAFFHRHGYSATVLPGITSALSAPLFATIPSTHRGVTDQILICTGTGRKGAAPTPPPYIQSQTVVFLMALHRLSSLVLTLTQAVNGKPWPIETPCAVVERASCPDQRVIRSTLRHVVEAVEEEGSRPPGLLVLGWCCEVLRDTDGRKWVVEEGSDEWANLMQDLDLGHAPVIATN